MRRSAVGSIVIACFVTAVPALSRADACNPPTTPSVQTFDVPAGDGVFRCATMNIPSGVTVKFNRNTTNTPVTFEITNSVTISGTIDVSGTPGGAGAAGTAFRNGGLGGPGGFDGGAGANGAVSTVGGAGLGPGGGSGGDINAAGGGGGYLLAGVTGSLQFGTGTVGAGGVAYGGASALPFIGGSGGGGGGTPSTAYTGGGGGGGGGALLIYVTSPTGTITFNFPAAILAKGGDGANSSGNGGPGGGGSGGTVRLVARTISGSATINVTGGAAAGSCCSNSGAGSVGRVRIEGTITAGFTFTGSPPGAALSMTDQIGAEVLPTPPTLSITQVAGVNAPPAPTSSFATPDVVLPATTPASVTVNVAATQIPPGTTVNIFVRGLSGAPTGPVTATLTGTLASSTASATVTIPLTQPAIITASVTYIRTADAAGGPMYVDGEPIERVRVATGTGGRSDVTYITRSGREVVVASR